MVIRRAAHTLILASVSLATAVSASAASDIDGPAAMACAVLPRPVMRIRLVVEPAVPADVRSEVEAAVTAVWHGEGLTLTWLPEAPAGQAHPTTNVWLRVVARPLDDVRARKAHPLGVVRFVGDIPRQDVVVSYGAVRDWARRERDRRFLVVFPGMTRLASLEFGGFEWLARRALGLAAAHEIGHYVLASKTHDASGLMRRELVPRTVAAVEHRDHHLSFTSRHRLAGRLASAAACQLPPAATP